MGGDTGSAPPYSAAVDIYNLEALTHTTSALPNPRMTSNYGTNGGPNANGALFFSGFYSGTTAATPEISFIDRASHTAVTASYTLARGSGVSISFYSNGHFLTVYAGGYVAL